MKSIQQSLEEKLTEGLSPHLLQVINESPQHNVPEGSESHFRALIVSDKFKDLSTLKRHQMVHSIIAKELSTIHAFSQSAFTSEEWAKRNQPTPKSPDCQHKKPS